MDVSMGEALAAVGVLFATVLTVLIEKLRRDNNRDHGVVREMLKDIHGDVEHVRDDVKDVSSRLQDHITWHAGDTAAKPAPKKRGRPRKSA